MLWMRPAATADAWPVSPAIARTALFMMIYSDGIIMIKKLGVVLLLVASGAIQHRGKS
jgi:hypothetical protein